MVLRGSRFSEYLSAESELRGKIDFIGRMNRLFFNQIRDAGARGFRKNILSYYPPKANGENATGVIYCGHLLNFAEFDLGIVTCSQSLGWAPCQHPNRKKLKELLSNENSLPKQEIKNPIFSKSYLLKYADAMAQGVELDADLRLSTDIAIVSPIVKGISFGGKVRQYWESYWERTGNPLTRILWPY